MEHDLLNQAKEIRDDRSLSVKAKVNSLRELYNYARAEQRAASESAMVDDDGLNDALRTIELALETLGEHSPPKDTRKRAATL